MIAGYVETFSDTYSVHDVLGNCFTLKLNYKLTKTNNYEKTIIINLHIYVNNNIGHISKSSLSQRPNQWNTANNNNISRIVNMWLVLLEIFKDKIIMKLFYSRDEVIVLLDKYRDESHCKYCDDATLSDIDHNNWIVENIK